jgi:hypothetical protein
MYPTNLQFLTKKIKNFTRQTVKLNPLSLTTATSQSTIEVVLPSNTLIDLSTLVFYSTGTVTTAPNTAFGAFPKNRDGAIFYRIQVEANGTILENGCNYYNQLYNTLSDILNGSPMEQKRAVAFSKPVTALPTANDTGVPVICNNFHGLLSTISPNVIDTGILGNIKIRFSLSPDDILVRSGTATSCTYALSNIYFSVDTLQISDGYFYNVYLDAINQNKGTVVYNYRQWISYSSSTTSGSQTTNFAISSQSLNRILSFFVAPSAFKYGNSDYYDTVADTSTYFTRFGNGSIGVGATAVNPALTGYQFNIQGQFHPTYIMPRLIDSYPLLLNCTGQSQDVLHGTSSLINDTNFLTNFWCSMICLEHGDHTFISGLDSRGANLQNYWTTYGGALGATLLSLVFCEVSSSVIVGSGFQLLPII